MVDFAVPIPPVADLGKKLLVKGREPHADNGFGSFRIVSSAWSAILR
jgi:hypothetical protein